MKKTSSFAILVFIFFLTSCKPSQKIVYNTDKIEKYSQSSLVSISVQSFEDIRTESEINQAQLQAKDVVQKINSEKNCINAEKLYKIPVGTQMAEMFAKHLSQKMYFGNVFVNQKENADYYITANLKHFYGAQKYSTKAAVGAGFGLIGALATSSG